MSEKPRPYLAPHREGGSSSGGERANLPLLAALLSASCQDVLRGDQGVILSQPDHENPLQITIRNMARQRRKPENPFEGKTAVHSREWGETYAVNISKGEGRDGVPLIAKGEMTRYPSFFIANDRKYFVDEWILVSPEGNSARIIEIHATPLEYPGDPHPDRVLLDYGEVQEIDMRRGGWLDPAPVDEPPLESEELRRTLDTLLMVDENWTRRSL